ncbi:endolytic transglycosylase MltG [Herbivorax sp. ANBcel31]|uniref:endolytic transglycosylase MltG n=1 Tax=Herbivorax sp. ANBcel31 TaxID=3069754 RepID=UPI0027B0BE66|nr:endolytic transglycosylase MltG [Herbivorax sp. ANBcel31]MDQ2086916.1 endolytic transglycosylase MltG [Herbivorax sp. ANBcel31]
MNGEISKTKKRKTTKKRKNIFLSLFLYILFFLVIFIISATISYNFITGMDKLPMSEVMEKIDSRSAVEIEIPFNSSTDDIAKILEEEELIKYPLIFKYLSFFNGHEGNYRSGQHLISEDLTYDEIMRVLSQNPISTNITIPEGKNFTETVDILVSNNLIDKDDFIKTATEETFDYKFLKDIPERENPLEGYLFPDTYFFDPNSSSRAVIRRFLDNFNVRFTPEFYRRTEELDMTVDEVITLASIIEKETKVPEEKEIVSSVFHNRLKSDDPSFDKLQSCATIQYIIFEKEGKVKETISNEDTKIEHPYNTYLHEGLPPGPICSPGIDSIIAALYPNEESDYMFFVARGDGSHEFSRTNEEHEAAKEKYEVTY